MTSATSTEAEAAESDSAAGKKKAIRASYIPVAIAIGFAVVTAASYVSELTRDLEDHDSHVLREMFMNVPSVLQLLFYVATVVLIVLGGITFAQRVKNWERGSPDNRSTNKANIKTRLENMRSGLYMQTLLRDPAAGIMHSLIYFSFLILLAVTTIGELNLQAPASLKFLHGGVYQGYAFIADLAGVAYVAGLVWAIGRRYIQKPYRIRIKTRADHAIGLGVLLAIGVTGFLAEGFRIAYQAEETSWNAVEFEKWSFIGYPLARALEGLGSVGTFHQVLWVLHVVSFLAFLFILPRTMLRHMFTSPMNMYLRDRERPKGAMRAMPNLMETELETFGASVVEDFTWKQLLDTDSCTMCGRCTSVCPAHATGKPLDPREIVLKVGEVMAASGDPVVSPPLATDAEITIEANDIFSRITTEEVWSCTTCRACDEACPVNIEILDKILDMRRHLTLMATDFPSELGSAFNNMENRSNPWGLSQSERGDWAKDIEGIDIVDGGDPLESEYLMWVGCAGAFDDKNRKVSQALAKLLQRAELSFSILGPAENCTGDSARRAGNEYVFQMLAMQNIEQLDAMGVRKIITQCPHCFNTLKNEYPQLGGYYEVIHHTELLERLIAEGKLDLSDAKFEERVVYHDSCYLGRHNDVYLAPRKVLGAIEGIDLVEAPRNGTKGMCCGAGGARMWVEEHVGKNVNVERSQELLATGATRIATACPFCYVMIDDGVKGEGVDDEQVKVGDISIHLMDAITAGENAKKPSVAEVLAGDAEA